MLKAQEPKYDCDEKGLFNRSSGERIPDDEPIFILRAKDLYAETAIRIYSVLCKNSTKSHVDAVIRRAEDFKRFKSHNSSLIKVPDTD